jgi:hypothetical protein
MTIQEKIAQVKLDKLKKDFYTLFNKLDNICKEETDMDIYDVLKTYDSLTNGAFSAIWEIR